MADRVKLEYKSGGGRFTPHSEGVHGMVVVDAIDMGYRVRKFQGKQPEIQPAVALVWASGETNEEGDLITVSKYYKASMHKKAGLRLALEAMRGRSYTEIQAKAAAQDPDLLAKLVGANCLVTIEHKTSDDGERVWANVTNITACPKGMAKPKLTAPYTRGDYWEERRQRFADEVEQFGMTQSEPEYPEDYDERPATNYDDQQEEELPF